MLGLFGFFIGLFLWAQILYAMLLVAPRAIAAMQNKNIDIAYFLKTLIAPIFSGVLLVLAFFFVNALFIGTLPAAVVIAVQVNNPKNIEDMKKVYPQLF